MMRAAQAALFLLFPVWTGQKMQATRTGLPPDILLSRQVG